MNKSNNIIEKWPTQLKLHVRQKGTEEQLCHLRNLPDIPSSLYRVHVLKMPLIGLLYLAAGRPQGVDTKPAI